MPPTKQSTEWRTRPPQRRPFSSVFHHQSLTTQQRRFTTVQTNKKKFCSRLIIFPMTIMMMMMVGVMWALLWGSTTVPWTTTDPASHQNQWQKQVKSDFLQHRRQVSVSPNSNNRDSMKSSSSSSSSTDMRHLLQLSQNISFSSSSWWSLKLALDRYDCENEKDDGGAHWQNSHNNNDYLNTPENLNRVAVFFQFGTNPHLFPDLMACATNVVSAGMQWKTVSSSSSSFRLDFYLAFIHGYDGLAEPMRQALQTMAAVSHVYVTSVDNAGADVGQFLAQFTNATIPNQSPFGKAHERSHGYDAVLKLHTKSDAVWRERMVESLCGSPEQVLSIWKALDHSDNNSGYKEVVKPKSQSTPTLIAPMGTLMGRHFNLSAVFPHVARKYRYHTREDTEPLGSLPRGVPLFAAYTVNYMNRLYRQLGGQANPVFGGSRRRLYRNKEHWIVAGTAFWAHYRALYPHDWKQGRVYENYVAERLTSGYKDNYGMEHAVERLIPSILVQRQGNLWDVQPAPRVLLNYDAFWPLSPKDNDRVSATANSTIGNNGNVASRQIRQQHGRQVARSGVQGLIYSWTCPRQRHVLQQLLLDGEPNLPFLLSINTTDLADKTLMQSLAPFLRHVNYIRISERPALVIQCNAFQSPETLSSTLQQWQESAYHPHWIVQFAHTNTVLFETNANKTRNFAMLAGAEASLQQIDSSGRRMRENAGKQPTDLEMIYRLRNLHVQYLGTFVNMKDENHIRDFVRLMGWDFKTLSAFSSREVGQALYFVTLRQHDESDPLILPRYLQAIRHALTSIPMKDVKDSSVDAHYTG